MNSRRNDSSDQGLTFVEIIQIVIMSIFTPLFTGLILYYGWKKNLPKKASQTAIITAIVCFVEIAIFAIPVVLYSAHRAATS